MACNMNYNSKNIVGQLDSLMVGLHKNDINKQMTKSKMMLSSLLELLLLSYHLHPKYLL